MRDINKNFAYLGKIGAICKINVKLINDYLVKNRRLSSFRLVLVL